MGEKINIAELLTDCPQGMELYSPIFGKVYLDKIRPHLAIVVTTDKKQGDFKEEFLYDGRYGMNGECMLFPSKGKTTWEGFQRPFKNEDVIVYDNPNKPSKDMEENDKAKAPNLKGEDYSGKRFGYKIPDGYEFDTVDNGKIILKPIKPKYPTTYEECYDEGNTELHFIYVDKDERDLYESFIQLIRCRNAYWKIAGEQMGLDKLWEPNWSDTKEEVYGIQLITDDTNMIYHESASFTFPTKEILNEFCKNFKELIEQCKELL